MAEIKIEKKKPIWPWILLAIVILALLYFLFVGGNDDDGEIDDGPDDVEMITDDTVNDNSIDNDSIKDDEFMISDSANSNVSTYRTYIDNNDKMGIDHEYTNRALTKLIAATKAVADSLQVDVSADLSTARTNAESVTEDPYKVDHADKIRNSGEIIVNALKTIQTAKFPDLDNDWSQLQNSIMAIKPDTKTLEQKTAVKNFFANAEELLTNMKKR
ncbi:hypothetical protein [Winogradskyella bathintestinalis]|uniref:Immunodominant membrane protein n=1 Tax=Winogradskyella bathintestinalis TaxID=3035208 RepID=A0ABT7ZRN3_9FLAO|nr:hypothetical protein [Winogradskyella bathintestinalis]MDN3491660.1 hypothetical protein [Winogradskyella bathintestinalis]